MVIGEGQGVLHFGHGGEVAGSLNNSYNVARALILEASMTPLNEKSKEVIAKFARLCLAWAQLDRSIAAIPPTQHLRISSRSQPPSLRMSLPARIPDRNCWVGNREEDEGGCRQES